MPTLALTNSLSFHQMTDPGSDFPGIRVLGTIGWIIAGFVITALGLGQSAGMFKLGRRGLAALGLYSFTLPHTPPRRRAGGIKARDILGLDALALMKDRSFAIFVLGSFLVCIPLQFYYALTATFLTEIGMANVESKMTFGQMSEIGFMLVMPFFFARLGVKKMLLIGMIAWTIRYVLFAYGDNGPLRVDALRRHHPARHLLRLLLRHRPDLRRQARAGSHPRRRPGLHRLRHARRRHVHRLVPVGPRRRTPTASKARFRTTGRRSGSCPRRWPAACCCCSPRRSTSARPSPGRSKRYRAKATRGGCA